MPLREATLKLEARGKAGRHGAIWQIIPTFNWLLEKFEEEASGVNKAHQVNYPDQEAMEDHYKINLNNGWKKLQKYYNKLDDSPVWYAATILNPCTKRYCKKAWKDQPQWLVKCDTAFQKLWGEFKVHVAQEAQKASIPAAPSPSSYIKDRPYVGIDDHINALSNESDEDEDED